MSDQHLLNPVGRLLVLCRNTMARGQSQQKSPSVITAWSEYLRVDTADTAANYRMLARVVEMPVLAVDAAKTLNTSGVPLKNFLAPIEKVGEHVLSAASRRVSCHQFKSLIDPSHVVQLENASFMLNHARGGLEEDENTLDKVRSLATEIRNLLVDDTDLDARFRVEALHGIERLQRAVDLYKIGGMEVIAGEVDSLVGATIRHHASAHQSKGGSLTAKLMELVEVVALATVIYTGPATMIDSTATYQALVGSLPETETVAPDKTE